jgi:phospholipase/carboxylesterase
MRHAFAALIVLLTSCIDTSGPRIVAADHLTARPKAPATAGATGVVPLELAVDRDGFIYVPASYSPAKPASLIVLLHGAGRSASDWKNTTLFQDLDARNIIALVPDSRGASWDLRLSGFGEDVEFIDRALTKCFSMYAIKSSNIALAGFSDGASYAVSLGVSNGDLFNAVMGFSPGFYEPGAIRGKPKIFLSHGTSDTVLPFAWTSTQLAPSLSSAGYSVKFVQFDGGHGVPLPVFEQALDWWLAG